MSGQRRPSPDHPRIRAFGEAALRVEIGGGIDPVSNALALALAAAIRASASAGWGDPVPAYDSVLVPFDPDRLDPQKALERLTAMSDALVARPPAVAEGRLHHIPVHYGGPAGPDLDEVADRLGLRPGQVVDAHAGVTYRVFMLGFAPGFAYLGPLPDALRLPRREDPRPRVPIGSVAIAGSQTAVYPVATPGGWHLIGRTDTVVWDARRGEPALLMPGDSVRFEPVQP